MPELLPRRGAVYLCSFVVGGVDRLKSGQNHQIGEGGVLPDIEGDGHDHRGLRITDQVEPPAKNPQHLHRCVHENAVDRIKDKLPGEDHRDHRRHIGQQDQSSYESPQGKLLVHHHGHTQPYEGCSDGRCKNVNKGSQNAPPKCRIGEHADIIGKTDIEVGPLQFNIKKTQIDVIDDGVDDKTADDDDRRQDEIPAETRLIPVQRKTFCFCHVYLRL